MNVPKEIADRAKIYEEAQKIATEAFKDVAAWLRENTGADGVFIEDLFVTNEPAGDDQGEGEFCDQWSVGYCGDSFEGKYYHPVEGSDLYLGYSYSC